jgi:hypothetical protein
MSPEIAEWDKTFRAWAAFDPGRCVNTVRCPIPPPRGSALARSVLEIGRASTRVTARNSVPLGGAPAVGVSKALGERRVRRQAMAVMIRHS